MCNKLNRNKEGWSACYGAVRGTCVILNNGQSKRMEELRPGEYLLSERKSGFISQIREDSSSVVWEVFCMDSRSICVTGNYLFARISKNTRKREWVTAEELKIGDWLETVYEQTSVVAHIEVRKENTQIYQIFSNEVQEFFSNGFLTLA